MYKESIILSQYGRDHCNYSQKCHLWFSPLNTSLLHWKSLLNSIPLQNNSEIPQENNFSEVEKKSLWEYVYKKILLFYGILVFRVQDETFCLAGEESVSIFVLLCCFCKFLLALRHGCYFCTTAFALCWAEEEKNCKYDCLIAMYIANDQILLHLWGWVVI